MSDAPNIHIRGARTHNLKNVHVDLPRHRLTVITGLSGSGKSSLAFDTLFAEGQRRYVDSLSAYARQFLAMMEKPDVDHIDGLSPAIAIEQKSVSHNPRSTVGTVTEVYDYLRLLFARVGLPHCPKHGEPLQAMSVQAMVEKTLELPDTTRTMILAPVVSDRKGEHQTVLDGLVAKGYVRVRIDGTVIDCHDLPTLDPKKKHTVEAVVDRLKLNPSQSSRLAEAFETAVGLSGGMVTLVSMDDGSTLAEYSANHACKRCGFSLAELEPKLFSFNSPQGACHQCDGLGVKRFMDPERVVHAPALSLAEGALRGWDHRQTFFYETMEALSAHYEFSLDTPFNELPDKIRQIILYGSGRERITFQRRYSRYQRKGSRTQAYEGLIPQMERRYQETDSEAVRDELARYLNFQACPACEGSRLCSAARHVRVGTRSLPEVVEPPIEDTLAFFEGLDLPGHQGKVADRIVKEIKTRLHFLVSVGLDYLSLDRSAETLSGGEAQRIRLASQIGSGLVGVMYVLDEPSIGLHQRDNQRLLDTLVHLRDLGNTVVVVEHDEDAIRQADHVIDMGPGAGEAGGHVVAAGSPDVVAATEGSITGAYLSGRDSIPIPSERTPYDPMRVIRLMGARLNNLKDVDMNLPVGLMTCVTGVSGSGKSSLINDTLLPLATQHLNRSHHQRPGPHRQIAGLTQCDKVVAIDQSPIGRTPRSNPATYTGLFTHIRTLFASTEEARARGYAPGRFSFNVAKGRCPTCEGDGMIRVAMHFLADMYVTCETCNGKRYNPETLLVTYKGKSIADVLHMTVSEAKVFFGAIPAIANRCQTLEDVGLGYIRLGQSATTLSGGEAQRIKLSKELARRSTGQTLYVLDEPTTGLHFHDVKQLLEVLHRLRDQGNTVVVIEHNLDVIKTADWVIDMGPEGGTHGGTVMATGTPEAVANVPTSYTGQYLARLLKPTTT